MEAAEIQFCSVKGEEPSFIIKKYFESIFSNVKVLDEGKLRSQVSD